MRKLCPECGAEEVAIDRELCWHCLDDLFAYLRGAPRPLDERRFVAIDLVEDLCDMEDGED